MLHPSSSIFQNRRSGFMALGSMDHAFNSARWQHPAMGDGWGLLCLAPVVIVELMMYRSRRTSWVDRTWHLCESTWIRFARNSLTNSSFSTCSRHASFSWFIMSTINNLVSLRLAWALQYFSVVGGCRLNTTSLCSTSSIARLPLVLKILKFLKFVMFLSVLKLRNLSWISWTFNKTETVCKPNFHSYRRKRSAVTQMDSQQDLLQKRAKHH